MCCFELNLILVWVDGIDFGSGLAFCSGDMWAWVFQGLVLCHVASHFFFAIHLGPPKRSILTRLQDATQYVHRTHPPKVPGLWISSNVEAS